MKPGNQSMAPSPYLTSEQAMQYLQLGSLSALYRLIKEWQLPYVRVGALYRFDTRELDQWMRRTRSATALAFLQSA